MQHSVKHIGEEHQKISELRKDKVPFDAKNFFNFAKSKIGKYHLVENGDDLLVSTWYSNDLIADYKKCAEVDTRPFMSDINDATYKIEQLIKKYFGDIPKEKHGHLRINIAAELEGLIVTIKSKE